MNDETPRPTPAQDLEHGAASPPEGARQRTNNGQVHPRPAEVATITRPGEGDGATAGATPPATDETGVMVAPEPPARPVRRPRFRDRPRTWWVTVPPARQHDAAAASVHAPDAPRERVRHDEVLGAPTGAPQTGQRRPPFRSRPRGWWIPALLGPYAAPSPRATPLADRAVRLKVAALLAITVLGAFVRFYRLDALPGEIFGDMVENIAHINSVLRGDWRVLYGSDPREGMLFFLAAPLAHFFGDTYLTLKVTVALIGIATIPITYLFAREIFDDNVALISAFLMAVSKWPLVFSRIGFRTVLTPLFVALTLYFLVRAYKYERRNDFIFAGLALGFGLYTYTGFRLTYVALALIFAILLLKQRPFIVRNALPITMMAATAVVLAMPMVVDIIREPSTYMVHPGPMLFVNGRLGELRPDWVPVLLGNVVNQLLMFNVRGDLVFRVNPTRDPALDVISGLLFLVGVVLWLSKWLPPPARALRLFVFVPFLVLQLNAVLDLNFPVDVPSSTRVTGIMPFVYLFAASGLWWLYSLSQRRFAEKALVAVCLLYICGLNYDRYFHHYAYGLPNHNTPIGRIIAQDVDNLPGTVHVYVVGCCWGDWGQPEPKGIVDALTTPRSINFVDQGAYSCTPVHRAGGGVYVVFPPSMGGQIMDAVACLGPGKTTPHTSTYGDVIFYSFEKLR